MNNRYYVYAKTLGQVRFRPMDFHAGTQTNRMVYATVISEDKRLMVCWLIFERITPIGNLKSDQ